MEQKQQKSSDPISEPKKKRRVTIAPIDPGIEANDCVEIYLVSSKEEAEEESGFRIVPLDLNEFIGDKGRIYGYKGLKIVIWISSVSFLAYADIKYESTSDRGKGVTDLKVALKDVFAENLVETKEEFLQTFSTENQYIRLAISKGETLQVNSSDGKSDDSNRHSDPDLPNVEVVRLIMGDMSAGHLYSRLVPVVLLLVDGSNPIDVTDSSWEMYVIVEKITNQQGEQLSRLLGFAAAYRFYHYPDNLRLRLSQILVLPSYQSKGYGRCLLELLNSVAMSENVHDLTVEEPIDSLQRIRYCIDIPRLLACTSVHDALQSAASLLKETNLSKQTTPPQLLPPRTVAEDVRKKLKINKKQFIRCWDILIYLSLDPVQKHMENYKFFITDRVKATMIGKDSGTQGKRVANTANQFGEDAFVMYKSHDNEDGGVELNKDQKRNQEQQLQQLVDERIQEIKTVAEKVSARLA